MILNPCPTSLRKSRLVAKFTQTFTARSNTNSRIFIKIIKRSDITEPRIKDQALPGANCVKCPDNTPACEACPPGQVCLLSTQTCTTCANVSCIEAILPIIPIVTTTTTSSFSSFIPSSTMSHTPFPSLDEGPINNDHTTIKQRAVIGGTVGGIFFILFVVWLIIWLVRSRFRPYNSKLRLKDIDEKSVQSGLPVPPVLQLGVNRDDDGGRGGGGGGVPHSPYTSHDQREHDDSELHGLAPTMTTTHDHDVPERYQRNLAKRFKDRTSILLLPRRSIGRMPDAPEGGENSNGEPRKGSKTSQDLENIMLEETSSNRDDLNVNNESGGADRTSYIDWNKVANSGDVSSSVLIQPSPPKLPSLRLLASTQSLIPSRFGSEAGSVRESISPAIDRRVSVISGTGSELNYNLGSRPYYSGEDAIRESSSSGSSSHQAPLPTRTRGSYIPIGYVGKSGSKYQEPDRSYNKKSTDSQYSSLRPSSKRTSSVYGPSGQPGGGFESGLVPLPERSSRRVTSTIGNRSIKHHSGSTPELSYPKRVAGHDLSSSDRYTRYLERESQYQPVEPDSELTARERLYEAARLAKNDEKDRYLTPRFYASTSHLQPPPQTMLRSPGHSLIRPLSIGKWKSSRNENSTGNSNENNSSQGESQREDKLQSERDSFEYPVLFEDEPAISLIGKSQE